MANIIGTNGNDTLVGSYEVDTIKGLAGNDTIQGNEGDDTLTGGSGNDKFVYYNYSYQQTNTITDFGGVGKGINPTAGVIAKVDTLKFQGTAFTAKNLLLTQNGCNLEITFERDLNNTKVILQNFALENLDNLSKSTGATVDLGNIEFDGQTSVSDSFDVFNANSTQSTIFNKNTVTFLNDLDNNVSGFDNSDDVINGQGGDDIIDGKSGNNLLRGGTGNDTLIGGARNHTLVSNTYEHNLDVADSIVNNLLFGGDRNDILSAFRFYYDSDAYNPSSSNNTLNGDAGDDRLDVYYSTGNNILNGGTDDDRLDVYYSTGNNILNGDAGNDRLNVYYSTGNNILNGGTDDDRLNVAYSTGNNILFGDDGNDILLASGALGDNTLNGGNGNNILRGGNGNDTIYWNGGNDTIDGGGGDNLLLFSDSDVSEGIISTFNATTNTGSIRTGTNGVSYKNIERLEITTTLYDDNVVGSNGNDLVIEDGNGNDTIDGGIGDDLLLLRYFRSEQAAISSFNTSTNTGSITIGTNQINYKNIEGLDIQLEPTYPGYDNFLVGSNGNDTLDAIGGSGNNTINGGAGDDNLNVNYSEGANLLSGGDGNDSLSAFGYISGFGAPLIVGNNTLNGGAGDDNLNVNYSYGNNLLFGGDGNDSLFASGVGYDENYQDYISASGNNTLNGGAGDDNLNVANSTGNNLLSGDDGNDILLASGALGNNTLNGGNGNDILTGGNGNDTLYGSGGIDTFAFNSYNQGVDSIYDFNATNELIQVSAAGFGGGLSSGSLFASQFTIGTSASTSEERFIYNSATGALFFDLDGSASGFTQVKFAQLSGVVALTENNFVVV